MDKVIGVIEGVGEYGLDVDHSPGVGGYYVKLYNVDFDASGYDTEKEAREELEHAMHSLGLARAVHYPISR